MVLLVRTRVTLSRLLGAVVPASCLHGKTTDLLKARGRLAHPRTVTASYDSLDT